MRIRGRLPAADPFFARRSFGKRCADGRIDSGAAGDPNLGFFPRFIYIIFKIIFKIYIDYVSPLVLYYRKGR